MEPVALGAAMLQTERWRAPFQAHRSHWPDRTCGVFKTPLLVLSQGGGWIPTAF